MVNRDLVVAKLTSLADKLERVRIHCPPDPHGLRTERDALDLVSFNLMLAVQVCADIASHIVSDEGWPAASSLADGFKRLEHHQVISAPVSAALCKAVGLRNIVAHGYSAVDPELVHLAASQGLRDLDAFAQQVSAWVMAR